MHNPWTRPLARLNSIALATAGLLACSGSGDGGDHSDAGTDVGAADSMAADATSGDSGDPNVCEEPTFAPVPESAYGVPIGADGYALEEIGEGLYWITNGIEQVLFLTTGEGVVLVDAPPDMTGVITAAIESVTDEPITHVVYSHYHADHIAGAGQIAPNATFVGHEATVRELVRAGDPNRPVPTVTFEDSLTLEVGSQTLQLDYHGPNHVDGNIFVYAPEHRALMVVDIVWPGWIPFAQLGLAKSVPGYVQAIDHILGYEFDVFVGGHVGRPGNRQDVELTHAYIQDLQGNAGAALGAVDFQSIAAEVGFENVWLLVDRYLHAVSAHCADATVPHWVDRLGGADVWTHHNCFAMVESLRID